MPPGIYGGKPDSVLTFRLMRDYNLPVSCINKNLSKILDRARTYHLRMRQNIVEFGI